jgi:hypothetical protein
MFIITYIIPLDRNAFHKPNLEIAIEANFEKRQKAFDKKYLPNAIF